MTTLKAPNNPTPVEDAEALKKACQGWGTDEKAIISVLGHRNAVQRKLIRQAYEQIYGEDLIKSLESELSRDLEESVYRWILNPPDRDAVLVNVALRHSIPDHRVIAEIASARSPEELLAMKRAYHLRYKRCLKEDVATHTSGDCRKLLVALLGTFRYDGDETNANLAQSEAGILHEVIQRKIFNHEEVVRILGTRSKAQLNATFNFYKDEHGTSITKSLLGDPADEFLTALPTAIRCIYDPYKYFEKVLRNAINKPGTDEDGLTHVIVTRAEKDLKDIKEMYNHRNNETLEHAIAKETSGDYKDFLLTLVGTEGH